MYYNRNHLKQACEFAGRKYSFVSAYVWHWVIAMKEFFFLLFLALGSLVHAFFPSLLNFKLLEWRIKRLERLQKELPDEPLIKDIKFKDK